MYRRFHLPCWLSLCLTAGCDFAAPTKAPTDRVSEAKQALQAADYPRALAVLDDLTAQFPRRQDLLLLSAEAASKMEDYPRALGYYERLRDDGSDDFVRGLLYAGDLHRHMGHMSAAEQYFREVLRRKPNEVIAVQRLSNVLNLSGRRWEATPWLLRLVQAGQYQPQDLLFLGNVDRLSHHQEYIDKALSAAPEDPLPWLGLARAKLEAHEFDAAAPLLQRSLTLGSTLVEAKLQQGWWLWDIGQVAELTGWLAQLPEECQTHPDYWVLHGLAARELSQPQPAIRCFGEAVLRDPDHRLAVYHLEQLLREQEPQHPALSDLVIRVERLQQVEEQFERLYNTPTDIVRIKTVADLMLDLGRAWEAAAWAQVALSLDSRLDWARDIVVRAQEMVETSNVPTDQRTIRLPASLHAMKWSDRPMPTWPTSSSPQPQPVTSSIPEQLAFADVASSTGLQFQFYNDSDLSTPGMRMLEFTGGGVAAVDYNLDGWPDLHLTQGSRWPEVATDRTHLDQFFRNRLGKEWDNVTLSTRLEEPHYSQGVAVGDFDSDGFPDLYVANIGGNRLFLNQGDGTFRDITLETGIKGNAWTTSVAMVDLNGDHHPDLFDVNYLTGDGVYTQICQSGGLPRACVPTLFSGQPDGLWLSSGDGQVRDVSEEAGLNLPLGHGLGLLVADFDYDQQLELFIANDAVPNYFLVPTGKQNIPHYENLGISSGLAFDRDGRAQACMGVAFADADGNGLPDLFVTNYYRESNTLYLQDSPLIFNDRTSATGLRDVSYSQLGFGTQFLDVDLDSWPDILVVNGHVDDFTHLGTPYRMAPQIFQNQQGQRFAELPSKDVGEWFNKPQLGRAMARLDWNRDGRDDIAVSHLDTPAALVTNQSQLRHHSISLILHGVNSNRDAIGTRMECIAAGRRISTQLVAGDGYQASNEHKLVIGLADADRAEELQITWPDGSRQLIDTLLANREYVIVQGRTPMVLTP